MFGKHTRTANGFTHGYMDVISPPPQQVAAPTLAAQREVYGYIVSKLDVDLLNEADEIMQEAETAGNNPATALWTRLQEMFQGNVRQNRIHLIEEFNSLKLGPDESIPTYISRIKRVRNQLQSVGEVYSDEATALILLTGLGHHSGYTLTCQIIKNDLRSANPPSLNIIASQLESKARELASKAKETSTDNGSGAGEAIGGFGFMPNGGRDSSGRHDGGRGGRFGRGRGRYHGRGRSGGAGRNPQTGTAGGRGNNQNGGTNNTNPPGVQCHACQGFGHYARDCANNKNKVSLAATVGDSLYGMDTYYLDSCSGEMGTPNRAALRDFIPASELPADEINSRVMEAANGGLMKPEGKGNMDLLLEGTRPIEVKDVYWYPSLRHNLLCMKKVLERNGMFFILDDTLGSLWKGDKNQLDKALKVMDAPWHNNTLQITAETLPGELSSWQPKTALVGKTSELQPQQPVINDTQILALSAPYAKKQIRGEDKISAAWALHDALGVWDTAPITELCLMVFRRVSSMV